MARYAARRPSSLNVTPCLGHHQAEWTFSDPALRARKSGPILIARHENALRPFFWEFCGLLSAYPEG